MSHLLPPEPTILRAKIVVVGEEAVGKTALTHVFHGKPFPTSYNMTLGANVIISPVKVPDTNYVVELHIFDMGGHAVFTEQRKDCTSGLSAIIGVYDSTSNSSLTNLSQHIDDALQWSQLEANQTICVLVGTKTDLLDENAANPFITQEAINMTASGYSAQALTCSAKDAKGCDEPFMYVAKALVEKFEKTKNKYKEM